MTTEHDTDPITPEAATVLVWDAEREEPVGVPGVLYGETWAVIDSADTAPTRKKRRVAKRGPRPWMVVHVASGYPTVRVASITRAARVAEALAKACPGFGAGATLGDAPDDGDEVPELIRAVHAVEPGAIIGAYSVTRHLEHLAAREEAERSFDDEAAA